MPTRIATGTLLVALAACTPHGEPERLLGFRFEGAQNPRLALDGDTLYLFLDYLHVLDLATDETANLGRTIPGAHRYAEVVASDGWAYWLSSRYDEPEVVSLGRLGDGRDGERLEVPAAAGHLVARGGCAFFTAPPVIYRWCPEDAAPVEIITDGPRRDFAVDDAAAYFFGDDGLLRVDLATGERTVIGAVEPVFSAEIAVDGDQIVWWSAGVLRAVPRGGGAVVELGTLPTTPGSWVITDLVVDDAGYFYDGARLLRGETEGEPWMMRGIVVAGGRAVWLGAEDYFDYQVYSLPSDAPDVAPRGGEEGNLRPPFL